MRVIEVDTAETFYSLRDRIRRGARERIVLVVPQGAAVLGGVDLPLLRRLADRERLEIGLVTPDGDLARRARGVGLPAFSSLLLAEHYRPGWWRGRRRAIRLGLPDGEWWGAQAAHARAAQDARKTLQGRSWRNLLLLVGALLLLLILPVALAVYALPAATVTLRPATQPAQVIIELTADPALAAADPARGAVPARPVADTLTWQATGAGTDAAARESVRALALQALNAAAAARLAARLAPGEWLVPGATRLAVTEEQFAARGGATRLTLTAEATGLAVPAAEALRLVYPAVARALPAGYSADPATLTTQVEAGGAPDRLLLTARAVGRAEIDAAAVAGQLAGRSLSEATRLLSALPLAAPPTLDVRPWPGAWGRLPFRPAHIRVELSP